MDEFVAWLNPKGVRELALKNALAKWWDLLGAGARKRNAVSIHVRSLSGNGADIIVGHGLERENSGS